MPGSEPIRYQYDATIGRAEPRWRSLVKDCRVAGNTASAPGSSARTGSTPSPARHLLQATPGAVTLPRAGMSRQVDTCGAFPAACD